MELFTVQMSRWRQLKDRNIEFIDTTVKSGEPAFAPTWELVMGSKRGEIDPVEYTEIYTQMMRHSYLSQPDTWNRLLLSQGPVAIACYCSVGAFCHRHVLKDILEKICHARNIPFLYYGEFQ